VFVGSFYRFKRTALPTVHNEFEFARIAYHGGYDWPRWRADWPEAEQHFSGGLNRLTRIDASNDGVVVKLTDPTLFDHPWLYVVEVGYMHLTTEEIDNLREYLLRGGFLMVDDFHGVREWLQFQSVLKQLFPNRSLTRITAESKIFNMHFDIGELVQVPGIRSLARGKTWEKGGINPGWHVLHDDHDRIMMVVNFNQDLGDGWEHADDAAYPEKYTGQAYRMGVNYVIYAMTH